MESNQCLNNLPMKCSHEIKDLIETVDSRALTTKINALEAVERDLLNAEKEFNLPVQDDKLTYHNLAAIVGSSLVTSSIKRDGKMLIAMVGLPLRGKTYLAKSLKRHFDWIGLSSEIFSTVEIRRENINIHPPIEFYTEEGEKARHKMAEITLQRALRALMSNVDIAIYDATNITKRKRIWLVDQVKSCSKLHSQVIFVESICNDPAIIKENIEETNRFSPEYIGIPFEEATEDIKKRVSHYTKCYEPLSENEGFPFVKLINGHRQLITNLMSGYIPGKILMLLMNQHCRPRTIFMSRHGESEYNNQGRIGGNSCLTPAGRLYASKLFEFVKRIFPPDSSELVVWTSTMVRTGETVKAMEDHFDVIKWKALDEINAGDMEGLTYEFVAENMSEQYQARKEDKLNYRYPGRGESYRDVFIRLEPVMFEMLRCRTPLLIVGHQAILRVLYGYLKRHTPQECPTLPMPLHTVIELTPHAYYCDEALHYPLEMVE